MASLFGRNALAERARQINTDDILEHVALIQAWLDDYDTGTLKKDKESAREQQYNADIFVKILGYRSKPASPYTFDPKDTTSQGQYPDAVLRYTELGDSPVDNVSAVVELKGASIPLDKPQQREGNLSPVQQAFKYKPQYRVCPFVVVSNFYEFRLYNDNQLDYEVWTLRDLANPADDFIAFKQWYYLLHADRFVAKSGKSETERFLSDVREEQIEVGEKFYAEYREIRVELLRDIWRRNPNSRANFQDAIKKAQTIIDRFVFVCFAEDSGLLPDDTLTRTLQYAEASPHQTIWEAFKAFFHSVAHGSKKLEIPNGYKGALFEDDDGLNAMDIGDEPLIELAKLGGKYDFKEKLTVKVLGHIFEQSITDLEILRERVEKGNLFDESKKKVAGRRKKEGVYYTKDYIVRYIVENTVGAYLRDIEERLKKKHNLSGMKSDEGYEKRERNVYIEYLYYLQKIRVLDPACGSGAFLVGVFDYLLAENLRVDDILGGTYTSLEESVRLILSDNIFGVDLNEESVEITKLSLWLKTAAKDKPLTSLDQNIKSGNSLVDADGLDDAPFDWAKQFPTIMGREGGFDVVVGNPPYVQLSQGGGVSDELREYFLSRYETSGGRLNTFIFFTMLAIKLLKPDGRMGYIIPNTLLTQDGYKGARKLILDRSRIEQIVEYPDMPFEDATVENITILLKKGAIRKGRRPELFDVVSQTPDAAIPVRQLDQRPFHKARGNLFSLRGDEVTAAIDLISKSTTIDTHYNINQAIALKGDRSLSITDAPGAVGEYYKLLDGRHISKYHVRWGGDWLEYDLSRIHSCKRKDIFQAEEKLFFRRTGVSIIAAYDDEQYFALNTLIVVTPKGDAAPLSLKALLTVLNSSVLDHYYGRKYKSTKTVFSEIQARSVGALPLPAALAKHNDELTEIADELIQTQKDRAAKLEASVQYLGSSYYAVESGIARGALERGEWKPMETALAGSLSMAQRAEVFQYFESVLSELGEADEKAEELTGRADAIIAVAYELTPELIDLVRAED